MHETILRFVLSLRGRGDEEVHAALDMNIPNYASAIVTTTEIVDSISSL
jgi:hypothetical protein